MSKPRMIEKAKDLSLVVLFLSTVLLLYFFWGNSAFNNADASNQNPDENILDAAYLIQPDQIVVNFGADNYTVLMPGETGIWQNSGSETCILDEINQFGQADNILVKEITKEQYLEAMKYRSIQAAFNFNIPMTDFCINFDLEKPQSYETIDTVTSVGYSTGSAESLLIYDGKNGKYYRMAADADHTNFSGLIDTIETAGYDIYYPASTYLGVNNNTLVPLALETNLRSFPFRQDTYSYQAEKISAVAENFFGGNFDFVRKITEDNGTIIYMYGYGQNVLIANTDGSIEYKEEQTTNDENQGFLEALKTAVQFVAKHGSWESLDGARLTPYLKDVIVDPENEIGYRFIFGMEINGTKLFYEDGEAIVIEVTSGQVTYYKRSMIDFNQEDLDAIAGYDSEPAFSSVNLIAQNYQYLYNILIESGGINASLDQTVVFEDVASLITQMQIGYIRLASEEITEIQPVWVVTINNINVYFDLYSAEPLGYGEEQKE